MASQRPYNSTDMERVPTPITVAVVGAGRCGESLAAAAERVGAGLAEAGATVVTGGLGGVMAAASRGARARGGPTIGVLPGRDAAESAPNPDVVFPIFTGLGQARNLAVVLTGDAVIAIGGSWGTLSEIALARKHGRPVVLLDSWGLSPPPSTEGPEAPPAARSPEEAVRLALDAVRRRRQEDR